MTGTGTTLTVRSAVHFNQTTHGRKRMVMGKAPAPAPVPSGRVPRVSRLMALAIRFDDLLARGEVRDYADIARLGHVTRARVTQIMNLLNLAPDIQEAILHLPRTEYGRDRVRELQVRAIAAVNDWAEQRQLWNRIHQTQQQREST
jgi:hypothetical protein